MMTGYLKIFGGEKAARNSSAARNVGEGFCLMLKQYFHFPEAYKFDFSRLLFSHLRFKNFLPLVNKKTQLPEQVIINCVFGGFWCFSVKRVKATPRISFNFPAMYDIFRIIFIY